MTWFSQQNGKPFDVELSDVRPGRAIRVYLVQFSHWIDEVIEIQLGKRCYQSLTVKFVTGVWIKISQPIQNR